MYRWHEDGLKLVYKIDRAKAASSTFSWSKNLFVCRLLQICLWYYVDNASEVPTSIDLNKVRLFWVFFFTKCWGEEINFIVCV